MAAPTGRSSPVCRSPRMSPCLPKALPAFRKRYPDVQLHLIEGLFPTLEAGLKDGSVDFYVGPAA